jgi:DNA helicase-2/ATP-dependent DNA helicase PcrA
VAVAKAISRLRTFTSDPSQQEAIEHVHGPMLVIAGAGTGKTTVLIKRLAHLISQGHARPSEILAVTYTRNAAQEMRDRIREELPGADLSGLRLATFHEYCNTLLQQNGKEFAVLDDQDLWIYLRRRIRELRLNHFVRAANVTRFLDDLLAFIRHCHDELVGPEKYQQYVQQLERGELPIPRVTKSKDVDGLSDEEVLGRCREIASVFATVERMLREDNFGTFGHMVTRAHEWLQKEGERFSRPRFILVDEFQDVNFAQVKVLQQLAGKEGNVFAVGDPDQAIYHFRGASSAAFLLFQRHFDGVKLVRLEKNRRSTSPILNSAFALISKNPNVFDAARGSYRRAPLVSAREQEAAQEGTIGEVPRTPVEVVVLTAKDTEFAEVTMKLRDWQRKSRCRWSDCAVLYRTHIHRDQVAAELARLGIPFSIENMDVMDMPEARDLFACLGAVVSDADAASLFRVAALPQFAIDPEKLRAAIRALPRDPGNSAIASVLSRIEDGPAVLASLQKTRQDIAAAGALGGAALDIMVRNFSLDRNSRSLKAVLDFAVSWRTRPVTKTGEIGELLEHLEYFREAGGVIPLSSNDENAVRLMTAHAAKGLEFAHVIILRANSNSFPASYKEPLLEFPRELHDPGSIAHSDDKELCRQEERRLFYVAMTRARDALTIYAKQGTGVKDPTPPGFMRDLLKDPGLRGRWLVEAQARGFQTDMFAQATGPQPLSRTSEWLSLPPASNLHSRLSASAIQTYETCPLQFKLDREWNIPGEVPAAMQYGAVMHRVLRAYYDSVRLERPIADDALVQLFRDDLAQAGFQDHYQHDLYLRQGLQQLQDFLAACRRNPPPHVLHTEEYFDVKVGDVTVAGRIDRIDQLAGEEVAVTDYKTGKAQSQEDSDESLQLSIYAIAAREKWGYRARHLVLYNLEGNSPVVTHRSDIQLEEAKGRILKVAESVAAGNFEPKPGFYCKYCAYRNLCPATEKRLLEHPE